MERASARRRSHPRFGAAAVAGLAGRAAPPDTADGVQRERRRSAAGAARATTGGSDYDGDGQEPRDDHVGASGALRANEAGSYDDAIRKELYPLLLMTSVSPEDEERGNADEQDAGDQGYQYQTLATQVRCLYEVLDDAARSVPLLERHRLARPGRFNTARLQALQQFVLGVGGAGMSVREQRQLYNFLDVWDGHDIGDVMSDEDEGRSLRAVFPTWSSFRRALRDDVNEAVLDAGWKKLRLQEGGTVYEVYFRSVLDVIMDQLRRRAASIQLWSGATGPAPPTNRRETPLDGDAFRLCEQDVVRSHGGTSFVMGIHLYSDSSLLSWSGGTFSPSY